MKPIYLRSLCLRYNCLSRSCLKIGTCLILLLTIYNTIEAQNNSISCACDEQKNLSPAGIMTGHQHMAHMWMFSYSFMSSIWNGNLSGSSKVNDTYIFEKYVMAPKQMQMDEHMLMGMYGLSDKLSIMLMLNYQVMNMIMNMLTSSMQMAGTMNMSTTSTEMQTKSHGFGDTKIYASYNLLSGKSRSVVLDVGMSIPTGSTTKTEQYNEMIYGQRLSYMMQLGSGTFDLLPGITYNYHKQNFSWSAQLSSILHPYYNHAGYKLGNELTLNTWAAYQWTHWFSSSFRISANSAGKIQGSDTQIYESVEPAAAHSNYGGKTVTALVGINYFFKDDLLQNSKIAAELGIPLYQYLNGIQLASKYSLYITWLMNF